MTIAQNWKDRGADLGDISTRDKASSAMAAFVAGDCKQLKKWEVDYETNKHPGAASAYRPGWLDGRAEA
jgi:hypothetical protein